MTHKDDNAPSIDYEITHLVEEHSAWLQQTPRTSLEALEHLGFTADAPDGYSLFRVERINYALWDVGFTPHPISGWNLTWHWLEGIPIQ